MVAEVLGIVNTYLPLMGFGDYTLPRPMTIKEDGRVKANDAENTLGGERNAVPLGIITYFRKG